MSRFGSCTRALLLATLPGIFVVLPIEPLRSQIAIDKLEIFVTPQGVAPHTEAFHVTNQFDTPIQVNVKIEDWDRGEGGENRFYPAGSTPASCDGLISVYPQSLMLSPGESQAVRFTVSAPAPLHHACHSVVFAETLRQAKDAREAGRTINYILRAGVKVYVEPEGLSGGGRIESVALVNKSSEPSAAGAGSEARGSTSGSAAGEAITIAFRNTGAVQVKARGTLEIRRPDNSVAYSSEIALFPVLPGARRVLQLDLPRLERGKYVALAVLDYGSGDRIAGQLIFESP